MQGVGFRPWVYQAALACALSGEVWNSSTGLTIEIEGSPPALAAFLQRLHHQPPPLARIETATALPLSPRGQTGFHILPSRRLPGVHAQVAPDTAPCPACRTDYHDPANHRYRYAFTNCTHCGPRYTITRALPYDRPLTTMAAFSMCAICQAEYDFPAARRFHAQPNACPACGPQLSCAGEHGPAALERAAARLRAGAILALKNVGGYQLACDAANEAAVGRLRAAKHRGQKPFALLAVHAAAVERIARLSPAERRQLESPARPIVLLRRRVPGSAAVAPSVAPKQSRLGIMLPSSPLHELLLEACRLPLLVMTSGNRSSEPLAAEPEQARERLGTIADDYLDHNRPIHMCADDSIGMCSAGTWRLLRRARGYVPSPISLAADGATVWAAGAELKNAFCLTQGAQAFLSPHLGDMATLESWRFYEQTFKHYLNLLGLRPQALVLDDHPAYPLNRWVRPLADQFGIARTLSVQHHHAHVAACMAEHQLSGTVLGLAWDGTGYGSDGAIWGGEFLLASASRFQRVAHLRPIALSGGDRAVAEPWRSGLAYLQISLGERALSVAQALWPRLPQLRLQQLWRLLQRADVHGRGHFSLPCTSAGRLFDAAAAILGLAPEDQPISFEGEAAMAVENAALACSGDASPYPFHLRPGPPAILDFAPMIASLVDDRMHGTGIEVSAARLHATLARAITGVCCRLAEQYTVQRICLSGGVFQNQILLEHVCRQLRSNGLAVFVPQQAPMNDGGLALGQAAVARARIREEAGAQPCV